MRLVYKPGQIQQDEGKLKRTPLRWLFDDWISCCGSLGIARGIGDRLPTPSCARDSLVHDTEGQPRPSVAFENGDPLSDPRLRRAHPRDDALARLTPTARERPECPLLGPDPDRIQLRQLGNRRC